jgi:hypothetical protein
MDTGCLVLARRVYFNRPHQLFIQLPNFHQLDFSNFSSASFELNSSAVTILPEKYKVNQKKCKSALPDPQDAGFACKAKHN